MRSMRFLFPILERKKKSFSSLPSKPALIGCEILCDLVRQLLHDLQLQLEQRNVFANHDADIRRIRYLTNQIRAVELKTDIDQKSVWSLSLLSFTSIISAVLSSAAFASDWKLGRD